MCSITCAISARYSGVFDSSTLGLTYHIMPHAAFVSDGPAAGAISLVNAPIVIDRGDFEGVHIAAATLAQDIASVTGGDAPPVTSEQNASPCAIIVGSVQKSKLLQGLILNGSVDVTAIEEKWETWCTVLVDAPWNGCAKALVICGSDKRGAIFGIYSLSEQIGVSP